MKTLKSEEAITILEDMKVNISIPRAAVTQIKRNVALNMAIDALLKCSEIPNDSDTISRQAAIDALDCINGTEEVLRSLPSVQPERLTDDDFETIRIHLNAYKEKLCNQKRWEEADEYQRIIDRFMAFASAQPERRTGR